MTNLDGRRNAHMAKMAQYRERLRRMLSALLSPRPSWWEMPWYPHTAGELLWWNSAGEMRARAWAEALRRTAQQLEVENGTSAFARRESMQPEADAASGGDEALRARMAALLDDNACPSCGVQMIGRPRMCAQHGEPGGPHRAGFVPLVVEYDELDDIEPVGPVEGTRAAQAETRAAHQAALESGLNDLRVGLTELEHMVRAGIVPADSPAGRLAASTRETLDTYDQDQS